MQPPRLGYFVTDDLPRIADGKVSLGYLTTRTLCREGVMEKLTFGSSGSARSWESPVCVAKETTVSLKAASGVLGADRGSALVKSQRVFWLVPLQTYPNIGRLLGNRLKPESVCEGV